MKKRLIALFLMMSMLFTLSAAVAAETTETFKTPKAALTSFYDGLRENDLEKMMAASYLDYADHYDYLTLAKSMGILSAHAPYGAPKEYDIYREMTKISLEGQFVLELRNLFYSLLLDEPYREMITSYGMPVRIEEGDIDVFKKQVDPARLSDLKVERIVSADKITGLTEIPQQYVEDRLKNFSADDYEEFVVFLSLDNKEYVACATLLKFGSDWRILTLSSITADIPLSGAAILRDEYDVPTGDLP